MSKGKCDNSIDDENYNNVIIEFYPKLVDDIISSFDAIREFIDGNDSELKNTIKSLKSLDEQKSSHSVHQEQEEQKEHEQEQKKENVENPTQQKPTQINKVQPTTVEMEESKTESNPKENKEESAKGGCCIIL